MIAPTTLAVAATLSAEKRYGSEAGTRSFQRIVHAAPRVRAHQLERARVDRLQAAQRVDRDGEERQVGRDHGHREPAGQRRCRQPDHDHRRDRQDRHRLRGRRCRAGSRAASSRECASTTPSTKPDTAPSAKPTNASLAVKSAASQSTAMSSGPLRREGSKSCPTMSQMCGMVRSLISNGHVSSSRSPVADSPPTRGRGRAPRAPRAPRCPARRRCCAGPAGSPDPRMRARPTRGGAYPDAHRSRHPGARARRRRRSSTLAPPCRRPRRLQMSSTQIPAAYDPARVIDDLRALADLTGGPGGARRLCWTDEWVRARGFLRERLDELPVDRRDRRGRQPLGDARGRPARDVVVGSHVDSVPNGGWLDGALGVMAALETLRACAAAGTPPVTRHARGLGRRGGRALRPQPLRQLGRVPARSIPTPCATCATPTAPARGRGARARRRARQRGRGAQRGSRRARLSRAAHRAGAGAGAGGPRRRHGARHRRRGAPPRDLPRAGRPRRLDADRAPPRLVPRGRPLRARAARDRAPPPGRLHGRRRAVQAGRRHRRAGRDGDPDRPAPPRRRHARHDAGRRARGVPGRRRGRGLQRRVGAPLAHRADPVRRRR